MLASKVAKKDSKIIIFSAILRAAAQGPQTVVTFNIFDIEHKFWKLYTKSLKEKYSSKSWFWKK
jgi:hypothetical protein